MSDDRTLILRIGGIGDSSAQTAYTTRPLGYSTGGVVAAGALGNVPSAIAASVDVLDPVGSIAGISATLVYGPEVATLLDSRISPAVDASGAPLRITTAAQSTDTGITVSAEPSGLSSGDLLYISGECVEYTGWTSGTSQINVTRAQLGTVARGIGYSTPGALILTTHSTIVGRRCTLSSVQHGATSESDEVIVYRGIVSSVSADGSTVSLKISSALGALKDAPYRMPRVSELEGATFALSATASGITARATIGSAGFVIPLDADAVDTSAALSIWLDLEHDDHGEVSVLVEGDGVTLGGRGGVRIADDAAVYLVEREDVRLPSDVAVGLINGAGWRIVGAELGDIALGASASDVVADLLTGQRYAGARARLASAEVDTASLDVITQAPRVTPIYTPLYDGTSGVVLDRKADTILEQIEGLLAPLGVSIAPSRTGTVRAIDWAASVRNATDISHTEIRGRAMGWAMSDASAIRDVTIDSVTHIGEVSDRIVSDVAAAAQLGGRSLEVECGHIWSPLSAGIRDRWRAIVALWDRAAPVLDVGCASSLAVELGDVVRINARSMISYDGARNTALGSPLVGVVTSVSPGIADALDRLTVVAFGWGSKQTPGVWGPAARVASYAGGVATVGSEFSGADDALTFDATTRLILLNDNGVRQDSDSPPPTATYAAGEITVTFSTATPAATDVLVPAPTADQAAVDGVLPTGTYWAAPADTALTSTGHYTYS